MWSHQVQAFRSAYKEAARCNLNSAKKKRVKIIFSSMSIAYYLHLRNQTAQGTSNVKGKIKRSLLAVTTFIVMTLSK